MSIFAPEIWRSLVDAWEVLLLFVIPIGGGIPGGVLLAKSKGLPWTEMVVLYFISDILLAICFEPITWGFLWLSERVRVLAKLRWAFRESMNRTIARYGVNPSPLKLILISFGVDPMTGRAAALAAGHGFISGWAIAIAGDMIFFTMLMISTLWLNNILGDGTWAVVIIIIVMTLVPYLIRRVRGFFAARLGVEK